jgi:predicted amidophosphoribosyltransferase
MRYASRGYNQAEEIARVLGSYAQKPVSSLVRRTHHTQFQSRIPFGSRHENVQDAFMLCVKNPKLYQGKHIIIVDDLMTSGATLRMVAKELLKLYPASITAVVAARVV